MDKKPHSEARCPVLLTLDVIGGKWKPVIVYLLSQGTRRHGELRRLMPYATQQMLTAHLRELERDGVVRRVVYPQVPPKVEYSLTPLGETLKPLIAFLIEWGTNRMAEGSGGQGRPHSCQE